ncbi:hypothetical protein [Micromonospora sp. NBC_01739]|uniref:hypothetical protein n=1 Tax=unclassified Micromonospora TaxID=2617518 RepID=UPI002E1301E7|nr:hypothetical protein OIE53_19810 [Micromonospora sp. NBC_01739]
MAAGVYGHVQRMRAETQSRELWAAYEDRYNAHLDDHRRTNAQLRAFGRKHEQIHNDVVLRMRDILKRSDMHAKVSDLLVLDGVDFSTSLEVMARPKIDPDVEGWAQGLIHSAQAGYTVWGFLHAGVNQIANAGTGTPLANLRGIAQENARKAALGGGPIASGGGGMALGALVEKIAVGGIVLGAFGATAYMQGEKAMTEVERYRAAFGVAIADLDVRDRLFYGVREQVQEKDIVLTQLAVRASRALDALGTGRLDSAIHGERFETAWMLVKAVQEVANAPVADEDGTLDRNTGRLIFKYRKRA